MIPAYCASYQFSGWMASFLLPGLAAGLESQWESPGCRFTKANFQAQSHAEVRAERVIRFFSNNSFACMDFLIKDQDIVLSLISVSGSAGTRIGGHQAMASGSE